MTEIVIGENFIKPSNVTKEYGVYDKLQDAYTEVIGKLEEERKKVEFLEKALNVKEQLNECYRKEIKELKKDSVDIRKNK